MVGAGLLVLAIAAEVAASALLPRAQGFTNPGWTFLVVSGYALSIWLLSVIVKTMPVSIAYAIWAGVGTAAVAVISWAFLGESLGPVKIVSLVLIAIGVVGLNLVGSH